LREHILEELTRYVMAGIDNGRKEIRADLMTEVEFSADTSVIDAFTIDVSESGLRLETDKPIIIRLRFKADPLPEEHVAELVWAKENDGGSMEYGFRYVEDDKSSE
jgi:hypothetical protein